MTEILVKPIREGNLALEKQYKLLFAHFPNLSVVPVDHAVAERAAFLRGKYGMKTPDALVIASAIIAQADFLLQMIFDWNKWKKYLVIVWINYKCKGLVHTGRRCHVRDSGQVRESARKDSFF